MGPNGTETKESAAAAESSVAVFCSLDEQVCARWRLGNLIAFGLLFILLTAGGAVAWGLTSFPRFLLLSLWLLTGCLLLSFALWWPARQYAHWSYRLTDRLLELRFGVIFRVSVLIPVSRLQHVDISRGPLDRLYGLATLVVHTAGTRSPSHEIPGLSERRAERLRDQLAQLVNLEPEEVKREGD